MDKKSELIKDLIKKVRTIPYYCGHPNCQSPGCLSIREARDIAGAIKDIITSEERKEGIYNPLEW